ncbi:MAG: glycosyltransferase family 4 protein [Candidatus Tritonobacter lacicola]|nr:glycosyltransferase family 4 protein [Candidatus Tritonobacter lacicola]
MRLLWLTDDYLPHRGGSRIVYHNICARIVDAQLCMMTRWMDGCGVFDRTAGYRIERVRVPFLNMASAAGVAELALYLPFLFAGIAEVRRRRPDILHCGEALASGLVGFVIRKMFGIPYVIWLHDNPFGPVSRLRYPLKRFLCLHADGIAASCNYARDAIIGEGYKGERAELINPGVDTSLFRPSGAGARLRARLGLGKKKVILTLSRLLSHKGQDMVIRALPGLISGHPDLVYLIGGAGPQREALEELARVVGVRDRVIFAGFIPQDEIADYYNACDIFIMLNREAEGVSWEGFGIVFLEASACGKPVIGGRPGGVEDSILDGVTGFLVPPEDVDEIVRRVNLLLGDGALARRMGAAGMERARSGFTWTESARKTLAFSEKIAGRRITDGSASGARPRD